MGTTVIGKVRIIRRYKVLGPTLGERKLGSYNSEVE